MPMESWPTCGALRRKRSECGGSWGGSSWLSDLYRIEKLDVAIFEVAHFCFVNCGFLPLWKEGGSFSKVEGKQEELELDLA